MNEWLATAGLLAWKPLLSAMLLPPIPGLVLVVAAASVLRHRPWLGRLGLSLALALLWLGSTVGAAEWIQRAYLRPPPPLDSAQIAALRASGTDHTAIVVLGSGRERHAPEYGAANLTKYSVERLRYGVWLSRQTGAGLMFSGGVGHSATDGPSEAEVAAGIAANEFGRPLRWQEAASRDTRENAVQSLQVLAKDGVTRVIVVTNGWHMARAMRNFERAMPLGAQPLELIAAPMALAPRIEHPLLRWMPSDEGFALMRQVVRERIGLLVGA